MGIRELVLREALRMTSMTEMTEMTVCEAP